MILTAAVLVWMAAALPFSEKHLEATCGTCHPLDPVRAARLSRSDWARELDKMEAMGAKIRDRQVLLNYLVAHYGRPRVNRALRETPAQ